MGTSWSVRFVAPAGFGGADFHADVQQRLDRIVSQMSHWEAGTDLDRFNRAAGPSWHSLPPEFFHVLRAAIEIAEACDGAFDPSAGPLVDLWGFGAVPAPLVPPFHEQIAQARAQVGWGRILLDRGSRRAFQPGGARLDLSGIAKGYGVDAVAEVAAAFGLSHFLAEVGGELLGRGVQSDGQPWWVEVEAPPEAGGLPSARIALHELAVATSGDYRRFFDHGARRYAHSIDPRSGDCVDNDLASVTVLHESCMLADAFATALIVLGPERGYAFAVKQDLQALFTLRTPTGHERLLSPKMAAMLD